MRSLALLAAMAVALAGGDTLRRGPVIDTSIAVDPDTAFGHIEHARLFPSCIPCHVGAIEAGPLWPSAASCDVCHDGVVEERVEWAPPVETRATNLRFSHDVHRDAVRTAGREAANCIACHAEVDATWMDVRFAVVRQCLDCHEIALEHLEAPDSSCATCHVPLAEAVRLSEEALRTWVAPPSHEQPGFAARSGHGLLAIEPFGVPAPDTVAANCATCHARDFCVQCHVDAPEQAAIRALSPDRRSLVHTASLTAPASHDTPDFLSAHGPTAAAAPQECRSCHTQESCLVCHGVTPDVAREMYRAASDRGTGAVVERHPPVSHRGDFTERHGTAASARTQTCASCHAREDCLQCHRPAARGSPGYHPADFLVRHPTMAYTRATSCSDCHNPRGFCVDCHEAAGLTAGQRLTRGFHDAIPVFSAGHGPAARQSLESCVSCHAERDCLPCHAAQGGRRFNPHGPGFDAERQARKNVEVCTVCHGSAVPMRP